MVCEWLYSALIANGAPKEKIVLSRQGVSHQYRERARVGARAEPTAKGRLKLLYLGRWDPLKGIDTVVRALRLVDARAAVQLSIYAASSSPVQSRYEKYVRELARNDARVSIHPMIDQSEIADVMGEHDVLVVPSKWLETGPLVVLEAQAAGVFVLGSQLGGIQELVCDGINGELIELGNLRAWTLAIERLAERNRSQSLPRTVCDVRTMRDVASDMAQVYGGLPTTAPF